MRSASTAKYKVGFSFCMLFMLSQCQADQKNASTAPLSPFFGSERSERQPAFYLNVDMAASNSFYRLFFFILYVTPTDQR